MNDRILGPCAFGLAPWAVTVKWRVVLVWALWLAGCSAIPAAVSSVPESEQAAQALKVIETYHGRRPEGPRKQLHVVYFTPADREPAPNYARRLEAIMADIQGFYRDGMERLGFGPRTFALARDEQGKLVIHLVKGREAEAAYPRSLKDRLEGDPVVGGKVTRECGPVLEQAGIPLERETVLIFCNLATWDEKARTFRHHSPYAGRWSQQSGLCWAADSAILDTDSLTRKEPILNDGECGDVSLGRHNTIFIGGIAHELGHAFGLPHCGERWDERALGTSLMGAGNLTYREERRGEGKGSFLTMASAMRLASRPLFTGSDRGLSEQPRLERCSLALSTNVMRADLAGRHGALRVEGTVVGSPQVYGVVAYFDSVHDGGYRAPTATSVPDAQGRFALEVSDLAPRVNGELRVEFCHVNGGVSERHLGFSVAPDGSVDLAQWETRQALEPVADAVARNQSAAARAGLQELEKSQAPELAKVIARKLVGTLEAGPKPEPADVPATTTQFALGDARAETANVGWLQPAANRVPPNDQVLSPLLDSGKLYATGLYAHAPSRYAFNLAGKWKGLSGEAGLHTLHQPYGSVAFVIKTDGHEVFRSAVIRGADKASYRIDLTGVTKLELIVDEADNGNYNDWGLWLEPILSR
jgi:hypothetical protein